MLYLINVIVLFISVLNVEGKQGYFGKRLNSCSFLVLSFFAQLGDQAKVFSRICFSFLEKAAWNYQLKIQYKSVQLVHCSFIKTLIFSNLL